MADELKISSRQKKNQTILPNGQVNISLLQREISSELKSNDRSIAQEAMKKKAIHSSTDYSEFENFVAASQLKPVSSTEMGQLFTSRQASLESTASSKSVNNRFNKLCDNGMDMLNFYDLGKHSNARISNSKKKTLKDVENHFSKGVCMKEKVTKKDLIQNKMKKKMTKEAKRKSYPSSVPRNAMEFEKELRIFDNKSDTPQLIMTYLLLPESSAKVGNSSDLLTLVQKEATNNDTFHQLLTGRHKLRIPSEKLIEMHKLEMNHTTLQRIIKALHFLTSHEYWQNKDIFPTVCRWTEALTQCGRFALNLQFLDEDHSICFDEIVSFLSSRGKSHDVVKFSQYISTYDPSTST